MAGTPTGRDAGDHPPTRPGRRAGAWVSLLAAVLLATVGLVACGAKRHVAARTTTTTATTEASTTTTTEAFATTTTSAELPTTTEEATTTEAPQPTFTEHAHISTWYTPAAADNSEWVHFKAVDEGGYTVAEVLGSDLMNMVTEANAMAQTPKRVELVNKLRQQMVADGWTEIGVRGDWYQYQYGR